MWGLIVCWCAAVTSFTQLALHYGRSFSCLKLPEAPVLEQTASSCWRRKAVNPLLTVYKCFLNLVTLAVCPSVVNTAHLLSGIGTCSAVTVVVSCLCHVLRHQNGLRGADGDRRPATSGGAAEDVGPHRKVGAGGGDTSVKEVGVSPLRGENLSPGDHW